MYLSIQHYLVSSSKLIACAGLALLTTLSLLLVMHRLVDGQFEEPPEVDPFVPVDITMPPDRGPEPVREALEKPKPAETPPDPIPLDANISNAGELAAVVPAVAVVAELPEIGIGGANYPVAHLLSQPRYPSGALRRGIEGWVNVKFDITAQGATSNIIVLAADPNGVFESAAVAAVKRWKYQPFVDDSGNAKPYLGLTKRVSFEMADEK